jgi:hypothetical protein
VRRYSKRRRRRRRRMRKRCAVPFSRVQSRVGVSDDVSVHCGVRSDHEPPEHAAGVAFARGDILDLCTQLLQLRDDGLWHIACDVVPSDPARIIYLKRNRRQ